MTTIPLLAFRATNDAENLDTAVYYAMASWLPSGVIPLRNAIPANPTTGQPLIPAVPAVPAKVGIAAAVLALSKYESTDTNSKFNIYVPFNPMLEAMYRDKLASVIPYPSGTGNVNNVARGGISLPTILGVSTLEQLLYYYSSNSGSGVTIERVVIANQPYFQLTKNAPLTRGERSIEN
jgi:hypothetical protein